jgi:Rhs element Vgr protein
MPDQSGVVTYAIKVDGTAIPGEYPVFAIHIEQAINRIATAVITLLDGSASGENFAISASPTFVPGREIVIEAGYDSTNKLLFKGIITKQSIRIERSGGPMLDIECKDKAIKMTVGRKNFAWSKIKDSAAISKLIADAGLAADVAATTVVMPELVQYYVTDWDFMLARAEVNSMLVSTVNNKVSVFNPTKDVKSVMTLTYGVDLFGLNADLNAVTQLEQVKASAWDYQTQKLIDVTVPNDLAGPGNLSSKKLAEVVGLKNFELQTSAAEPKDDLSNWAKAQMLKSEMSKIIGNARAQGSALPLPGKYLTLDGLGARFDGNHFISGVVHDISDGNWMSNIDIGMSPLWFVQEHEIEAPPAAGLLPGIQGLFTAKVNKIDADPDSEYRILVEVALFNDKNVGLWARLANFYSTNGQGVFFLPEIGDEVILGFLNQDPRYPVILGSLYSQKNKPFSEFVPNQKNSLKGIVSKSTLRMMFDDENKILTLITPAKNTVVLDDKGEKIEIKDQNGNKIVMEAGGITISSPKDITLDAGKSVTIKGKTGVSIQASAGDVTVKGKNIKQTADMQFSAKGSLTAEVKGGTQLTLKAAMVMIN